MDSSVEKEPANDGNDAPEIDHSVLAPQHYPIVEGLLVLKQPQ